MPVQGRERWPTGQPVLYPIAYIIYKGDFAHACASLMNPEQAAEKEAGEVESVLASAWSTTQGQLTVESRPAFALPPLSTHHTM